MPALSLAYRIASIAREKVDEVMDAHIEQLSMIFCAFFFTWTYEWLEANAIEPYWRMYQGKYGHLPWRTRLALWSQFGFYQLVFAILTPSVTFSFGLIFGFAIRLALSPDLFRHHGPMPLADAVARESLCRVKATHV